MLRSTAFFAVALSAFAFHVTPQEATGIQWEPDLATALAKSKDDGRPAIAFFTFDT